MKTITVLLALTLSCVCAFGQAVGGNGVPGGPSSAGVSSINTVTGAFTFSGSGVSCTGAICTFTGGGAPTGAAGGILNGTYPNPGYAVQPLVPANNLSDVSSNLTSIANLGADPCTGSTTNGNGTFCVDNFPTSCSGGSTNLDCAVIAATSYLTASTGNGACPVLSFGATPNYYKTNLGVTLAPATYTGSCAISLQGAGDTATWIYQNASNANGTVYLPQPTGGGNNPKRFFVSGMTIQANSNAPYALEILGQHYQSQFKDLTFRGATTSHLLFGATGVSNESGQQDTFENILGTSTYTACAATGTVALSGGAPTITITSGSSSCDTNTVGHLIGYQNGASNVPCSSAGAVTVTISGGAVTAATSTATGCVGTVYVVFDDDPQQFGLDFDNLTDSTFTDIKSQAGWEAGLLLRHGNNALYHVHSFPIKGLYCIENRAQNTFDSLQMGECASADLDTGGTGPAGVSVVSGSPEYNTADQYSGQSIFRTELSTNYVFASNVYCGVTQTNEFHTLATPSGTADTNAQLIALASGNKMDNIQYCGSSTGSTLNSPASAAALPSGSTLASPVIAGPIITNAEYSNSTCTTSKTINPANGVRQNVTLTASDTCTLTWTQPSSGTTAIQLKIISPASGTGQIGGGYWPSGSGFTTSAPTISATGSTWLFATCYLDGTNANCALSQ